MKDRCYNPNNKDYKNYGARGIVVCDRWLYSFENFIEDMGKRPSDEHLIDRIENNDDYFPKNCKWSTIEESNRNSRNCHFIEFNGQTKTMIEWSEEYGIEYHKLADRINKLGWDIQKALTTKNGSKSHPRTFITYNGKTQSLSEWATEYNIDRRLLSKRINRDKWPIEKALTTPKGNYKKCH